MMNERIKELEKRCWDHQTNHLNAEKFAELIVRNCIDEMVQQMWNYGIDESNNPSFYKAVEKAKQHFGVV